MHQLWSTSYGRALIAKTALFIPLVALGWLNRTLLLGMFARLRRSVLVELTVCVGIVIAVAVLTELRPGRDVSRAIAATSTQPWRSHRPCRRATQSSMRASSAPWGSRSRARPATRP